MKELVVNDEIYIVMELNHRMFSSRIEADTVLANYKGPTDYRVVKVRNNYFLMTYSDYSIYKTRMENSSKK